MHPNIKNILLVWGSSWDSELYTLCLDFVPYKADTQIKVFYPALLWTPAGRESPASLYILFSGYPGAEGDVSESPSLDHPCMGTQSRSVELNSALVGAAKRCPQQEDKGCLRFVFLVKGSQAQL